MRFSLVLLALLILFGFPLVLVLIGESHATFEEFESSPPRRAARYRHRERGPVPVAPAPVERPLPTFASSVETEGIVVRSDGDLALDGLRKLCLENLATFREWLGAEFALETTETYEVYICESTATLESLARAHAIPTTGPDGHEYDFRGGVHEAKEMILITSEPYGGLDRSLAHELAHAAWAEAGISDSCALVEGFAENAAIMARDLEPSAITGPALAEALYENRIGSLESFLNLEYWDFHESSRCPLHYAMAFAFVNLLLESSDPEIEGRFLTYLDAARRTGDAWEALCHTYDDVAGLERAWKERMRRVADWDLVYGDWNLGDDWQQGTVTQGSGIALIGSPDPDRDSGPTGAYTLSTRITRAPNHAFGVGFVVGYEDPQNYLLVILRPDLDRVTITARENGLWQGTERHSTGSKKINPQNKTFRLRVDAEGTAELWLGPERLARHELGLRAVHGRAGLFLEHVRGRRASVLFEGTERTP